jgi:tetratricopeptide (TPR) repeat protein
MSRLLENFKNMLEKDSSNPLLHYSLGNEYFKIEDFNNAETHLRRAVELSPDYSAAWKILGKVLSANNRFEEAVSVLSKGIEIAEGKGDIQAAKEMKVFLKRANKHL